jgi:predicted RND superfamily exporter protein
MLFARRRPILLALMLLTALMAWFAAGLRMDAGFDKQMPTGHPYTQTFHRYQDDLLGANRLNIVVRARQGEIWSVAGLQRLHDVTQAVILLPGVQRAGVQSLWTPNTFVNEITEEGFRADPLIPATVTAAQLTEADVSAARIAAAQAGFIGTLVSSDNRGAMVNADLLEFDAQGRRLDYIAFNHLLEAKIRRPFEDAGFEVQIIGFAKQLGDIADGALQVLWFCAASVLLAAAAVWWYCRSWRLTVLPIVCSLTSLVWQFGALRLLGYGLDPLAVLVPFLVFAIGVSHGVQQINFIVREIAKGASMEVASRASFSGLLVPGSLALVTALVSFVTMLLIPIPMVRELAIAASLGVGFKIVTNLVMLPLAATHVRVDASYAQACHGRREQRVRWLRVLGVSARPGPAALVLVLTGVVLASTAWYSRDRVVGSLQPGAPELRQSARYNQDALSIAEHFDAGLDWLSVVFEAAPESCDDPRLSVHQDRFAWAMRDVPGVRNIQSFGAQMRLFNQGYNEGQPKMAAVPLDPGNHAALATEIGRVRGYASKDCAMTAVHLFLADHKATTIAGVIAAAKRFAATQGEPGITLRLAAGNAGVMAAINEEVEHSELPMMLYVYAAITVLVFAVYRDWRAMVACCLPLTVATFVGYAFMKLLGIGLTVATLPVMVLAVGIGVDYALYIYNRLQLHLAEGQGIEAALGKALEFEAMATVFTALTLAACVVTWSFSALKFQSDMGKLLAFMFIVNLVMAMTTLPALAYWLERWFPRRSARRINALMAH